MLLLLAACAGSDVQMKTVKHVDMQRYAGDWYLLAHIPTRPEKNAYDGVESYSLREDGKVDIAFRFREGGFDGEAKELTMLGTVHDKKTNAEWRVRPFWPLSIAYLVLELDEAYSYTVVGHPSGDYVWIMSREPSMDEVQYASIVERVAKHGFDPAAIRRVPQSRALAQAAE